MRPYYAEGGVTIYHGDCREIMPEIKGSVIVTDPPYGTGHYEADVEVLTGPMLREWIAAFESIAVFGWPERLVGLCVAANAIPDEWVTWWPTNGALRGRNSKLWRESEHVAVFDATPNAANLKRPRNSETAERMAAFRDLSDEGARLGDVWREASPGLFTAPHLRLHPNMKPVEVMRRLVVMCSTPQQVVIDPFMGSGTTLRAAMDCGRVVVGIEVNEEHCATAVERLAQSVLDLGEAA